MTAGGRLVAALGVGSAGTAYGDEHVELPADRWVDALLVARDVLGFRWLDFVAAYEDGRPGEQMTPVVVARLWSIDEREAVILRTALDPEAPVLASATGVFAGAAWHEREVMEMFGVRFEGHPDPRPLLLAGQLRGSPAPQGRAADGSLGAALAGSRGAGRCRPSSPPEADAPRSRAVTRDLPTSDPANHVPADSIPDTSRGVIALDESSCTVCMLCVRECPDWCIDIEGHPRRWTGSDRPRRPLDLAWAPPRAGPVRDRLVPVHVLRDLRRGVPLRRALLVPVPRPGGDRPPLTWCTRHPGWRII